jgi:hypothetical protein
MNEGRTVFAQLLDFLPKTKNSKLVSALLDWFAAHARGHSGSVKT